MIAIRIKGDMPDLEPVKNYFEGNFPEAVLKVSSFFDLASFTLRTAVSDGLRGGGVLHYPIIRGSALVVGSCHWKI